MATAVFPFSAVVGHDDLRTALLLNAVHPGIGGVLVRGEKGTAKSTVVRALAALLPDRDVVVGCRFACEPERPDTECPDGPHTGRAVERVPARLVELPVGATEDRVTGSLDLQRALSDGERAYQPGLLAAAHRGVLYADEVNLLQDHLVDLLLDAAAMGRCHVERDGVSVSHASRFVLVGTMNPEEGELRPQLLDRFGLAVSVTADRDVTARTEVIRRRLAFEADPAAFAEAWRKPDADIAAHVSGARGRLDSVRLPDSELRRIAALCAAFEVDGMRADLVVARAAVANAAWRGADSVAENDVEIAARLALPHRGRRDPFDEPTMDDESLSDALRQAAEHADAATESERDGGEPDDPGEDPSGGAERPGEPDGEPDDDPDGPGGPGGAPDPGESGKVPHTNGRDGDGERNGDGRRESGTPEPAFRARLIEVSGTGEGAAGRRSRSRTTAGATVRAATSGGHGLHVAGTLSAAAPRQRERGRSGPGLVLHREDARFAVRSGREGNLVVFVVDASGSMAARSRMSAVTGAVISLLRDAYQRRDRVGVIAFRGDAAELVLPATTSVEVAATRLRRMRTGGRTPLADALRRTRRLLASERVRDPSRRPLVVLLTDGRATSGDDPVAEAVQAARGVATDGVASVVVDCESGPVRLGMAGTVAAALRGPCLRLEELSADSVSGVVRTARAA
ncbi:MAG: magnesium chelatase subunit D family protein [Nocardioidaceae bacterium]